MPSLAASPAYFNLKVDEADRLSPFLCRKRWLDDPALQREIRETLERGEDLPPSLPTVREWYGDRVIDLVDLRGIDLSELHLGAVDLSYCCLDFADLTDTILIGTHLQFSSCNDVWFERTIIKAVQASPLAARGAYFRTAQISSSFFLNGDFLESDFSEARVEHTTFSGSRLSAMQFERAIFEQVDCVNALLDQNQATLDWLAAQSVKV